MKNNLIWKSIKNVIVNNILLVVALIVIIVAVVLCSLIPPQLLKIIIDRYLTQNDSKGLLMMACAYLAALIFVGVFDFIKEGILVVAGQKITKEIRIEMMCKLEKINSIYFSDNASGSVVSRFTNDVDTINTLFTGGIISMVIDCFKVIGIVVSIWVFSSYLGIVTLVLLPAIFVITRTFQKKMLKAQIRNRVIVGKVNNHISESLKNIRMIKIYGKEKYMEDKYREYLKDNFKTVEKVNYYDSVYPPIIQCIRAVVISVIVLFSSKQLNFTGMTLGMVAASIDLFSNLFIPMENLGMELQSIQSAMSGIKRVNGFYMEKEDEDKNKNIIADEIIPDRNNVCIKFNDLSFNYIEGVNVLNSLSLTVNSQEKTAFIGRTGVGKSTLFNLIMGFYKPTQGSITINGADVYTIDNSQKRKIFGYVNQNTIFIKGTVAEQITLQDETISMADVVNAMKLVGLHDYVMSLDKGYDTVLNRDNLFSQGQKQLLGIARALVADPPILLLDEVTANLDSITEEKILAVLQQVSNYRTILSISHRMSSMASCDKIVMLEDGRIKSVGTLEDMIQTDSWYRKYAELEKMTWVQ